eukprot:3121762-Prymnesium_polylepis.2
MWLRCGAAHGPSMGRRAHGGARGLLLLVLLPARLGAWPAPERVRPRRSGGVARPCRQTSGTSAEGTGVGRKVPRVVVLK